jgi:hypothetical protein
MAKFFKGRQQKQTARNSLANEILRHSIIYGEDVEEVRRCIDNASMLFDSNSNVIIGRAADFPSFHNAEFKEDAGYSICVDREMQPTLLIVDCLNASIRKNGAEDGDGPSLRDEVMKLANGRIQTFFLVRSMLDMPPAMFFASEPNYISHVDASKILNNLMQTFKQKGKTKETKANTSPSQRIHREEDQRDCMHVAG